MYDEDGSGAIDYEELRKLLKDLGWPAHDDFLGRAVRVLDQDMSGDIEFSEFQKWTQFAYASRVLYREEMFGSSPRYPYNENMSFASNQETVYDDEDGPKGLVIRRSSLTTVLEGKEVEQSHLDKSEGKEGQSTEHEETRPGTRSRCMTIADQERNQNEPTIAETQSRLRQLRKRNSVNVDRLEPRKNDTFGSYGSSFHASSSHEQEVARTDTEDIEFSAPIVKMADMVLGSRRSKGMTTSRARSKSLGLSRSGICRRGSPSPARRTAMGPRTESKVTVRMRWACGQFDLENENSDEGTESSQQSVVGSFNNTLHSSEGKVETCEGDKKERIPGMSRHISCMQFQDNLDVGSVPLERPTPNSFLRRNRSE